MQTSNKKLADKIRQYHRFRTALEDAYEADLLTTENIETGKHLTILTAINDLEDKIRRLEQNEKEQRY
jgi:hypothetical protein